ncbi:hypothetical protein [Variovorax sp. GB4R4]|uniref:hypothetical protein n=1 Tax=Variovorax sp. GB4R4 TaxID=3443739 RepID=UPI003F472A10
MTRVEVDFSTIDLDGPQLADLHLLGAHGLTVSPAELAFALRLEPALSSRRGA